MHRIPLIAAGKALKRLAQIRGGGSALPGLLVERVDPDFMRRTLAQLPYGVVLISGTNGKTTTTKMVVAMLEAQGLSVFTNRTGSNFTRGVAAALLGEVNRRGQLDADVAVLELDEAHAVHFVRAVPPTYSLFLNVMRDQLDRFGEIDTTAKLLRTVAEATTRGIVINRDDPRLGTSKFVSGLSASDIRTFGIDSSLLAQFPTDDHLHSAALVTTQPTIPAHDTSLKSFDDRGATFSYDGKSTTVKLKLKGIYNIQNAAGALALVRLIMGAKLDEPKLFAALASVEPAFGRGEMIELDGQPVELVLVKNPSGFRLSLSSFDPSGHATMIAVNDQYADGRDMSWLWDVDFAELQVEGVGMVSGLRAYDMALRLQYDLVEIKAVEPNLAQALDTFIASAPDQPKRIYCTYTAMLTLRRLIAKRAHVEVVR